MSEMIKFAPNGQWTLEKNWTPKQKQHAADWAESGMRRHIDKLPKASGRLRSQMLADMEASGAESRTHPELGHKEYKLYRNSPEGDDFHTKNNTSWTTDPNFAYHWASINSFKDPNDMESQPKPQQVMHAWVPEQHIHSFLPSVIGPTGHEKTGELEVIVQPHSFNIDKVHAGKTLASQIKKRVPQE